MSLLTRTFFEHIAKLVDAKICVYVPPRWNNIAMNWITNTDPKKAIITKPIGSNCRYSVSIDTVGMSGLS